jgi:MFS transporter, ACS family, glucarate transporter
MGTLPAGRSILKPTRVRLGVLAFASSLSILTYLDRVCISQAQRDIQFDLHISDVGMGLVLAAFAVGYGLFEVPGGAMGDRWGSRRVLTGIVLFWSLFTALTGAADFLLAWTPGAVLSTSATTILVVLVAIRFLFGCGEAGAYPNIARVVNGWFPFHERGFAQGVVWMSARLGGAVSFVTVWWLTSCFGWRQAFLILGLAGGAWCVAFHWWFRNTPEETPSCNEAERRLIRDARPAAAPHGHAWPPLGPMAASPTLWAVCVAAFGVSAGWWFFPAYQPKYLAEVHHMGATGNALLAGLPFLFGAGGSLAGGWLSDVLVRKLHSRRWGRSLVGIGGFGGAGLCVLATGFVGDVYQAYTLLCLAFFINDLAVPVLWQASADISGRYVGTVSGIMNMIGAVGAFLSMFLTPVVMEALPKSLDATERWRLVFAGYAGCWFLAAAAWLVVDAGKPLFESEVRSP